MSAPCVPALEQQQGVRVGLKMVAANKMSNGMEDFSREVLHGRHVDCARKLGERRRESRLGCRVFLSLQSGYVDTRIQEWLKMSQ